MNLKTIAKMAGVSTVTVSNVINGKYGKASRETIQRVRRIIEETNYHPSATARSLIMKRSRIIGVVIPDLSPDESFSVSPYNAQMLGYLDRYIRNQGYYMMLRCVARSFEVLEDLATWNIDGVFFLGVVEKDAVKLREKLDIPAVFIDTHTGEDSPLVTVTVEDRKGGYLAAKHFLDRGHRRLAFVGPSTWYPGVMQERYCGFCDALRERGLEPDPKHLVTTENVLCDQGVEAGRQLAASGRGFTAVVTAADILAFGVMEGLRRSGLRVPEDVSVIGFDDLSECRYTYPGLTTISQNIEGKARCAGECLFSMLDGRTPDTGSRRVDVEVVERASVIAVDNPGE